MRISDWSSDVCSSDLRSQLPRADKNAARNVAVDHERDIPGQHVLQCWRRSAIRHDHEFARRGLIQIGVDEMPYRSLRSEERRGGKECVSTCISRWSPEL